MEPETEAAVEHIAKISTEKIKQKKQEPAGSCRED